MKNVIVWLMAALLLSTSLSSAQECLKSSDPFTNEPVVSFEWKSGGIRTLLFETINTKSTLEIRLGEMGAIEQTIAKGSDVWLKLENGDVIKLTTILDTKSVVSSTTIDAANNVTSSTFFLKMVVTNEQLNQLAKFKVTNMRTPDLHGGYQTYGTKELRNKFERFLQEGAKCLTGSI